MFDGNSMNYPRFIENFKTNIEERESDPKARLRTKDLQKPKKYWTIPLVKAMSLLMLTLTR